MSAITAEPVAARRLTLVPLRAEHAGEMAAVLADPKLYTFTGGSPPTPQALYARYERLTTGSPDPAVSWCNWVIQLRSPLCLVGAVQATISTGGDRPTSRRPSHSAPSSSEGPTGLAAIWIHRPKSRASERVA